MQSFSFWLIILLLMAVMLQQNWVYYIVYVVGGVWILSLIWSKHQLRWTTFGRQLPSHAFSGETVTGTVNIRNRGWLPLPWVRTHEQVPSALRANQRYQTALNVRGKTVVNFDYSLLSRQRGYYQVGPTTVNTGDFFGFADNRFEVSRPDSIIVFPKVIPLEQVGLQSRMMFGTMATRRRIFEDPTRLSGIRPYLYGDALKHVHWKASAHEGRLLSKKFDPAIALDVVIALDLDSREYGTRGVVSNSEWAIVIAASMASYLTERQQGVGLRSNGIDAISEEPLLSIPARTGRDNLITILESLARIKVAHAEEEFNDWLARNAHGLAWGTTLILVVPALNGDLLWILHGLFRKGMKVMVLVLLDQEDYTKMRDQGEALGLSIWRIHQSADLHELALAPS